MKASYLIPHKYKLLGWILFVIGIISGLIIFIGEYDYDILKIKVLSVYGRDGLFGTKGFFKIIENSILDEIVALCIIAGGLLVGFSKERIEDEFIYKLRKDSLVWAIIFNYVVLIFAVLFVYNFSFFDVLVFNMFTPLLFFVIRFNFLKLKSRNDEE